MSRKQKLIILKQRKNEKIDEFSETVMKLNITAEKAQEWKRDNEAEIEFLNAAPEDFIEEHAERLIAIEEEEVKKIDYSLRGLVDSERKMVFAVSSTSGTASVYLGLAHKAIEIPNADVNSMQPVIWLFGSIAEDKARKASLPEKLNKINPRLGEMFIEAGENVELGRANIMKVNKAMLDMRSVLNQLWGGIVNEYRIRAKNVQDKMQGKEISKHSHRDEIAEALAVDTQTRRAWTVLLDEINTLLIEISQTQEMKNPLNVDVDRLNEFYNRWIAQINDAVNLLTALDVV